MTTPNINDSTKNITGHHAAVSLGLSETTLINNAATSNKLIRVAGIYVANKSTTDVGAITMKIYNGDDLTGSSWFLASAISVPVNTTMVLVDKNAPIYLREDQSIGVVANNSSLLDVVISYEEIS